MPALGTQLEEVSGYSAGTLFFSFLKIGAVLYGTGYVLLAFLRGDFVERLGWITEQQLLDAVAVGQVTLGPVFTTATFIGYVAGGLPAAALATVALLSRMLPLTGESGPARSTLDWINAASLGLMGAVTYQLAVASIIDPFTIATLGGRNCGGVPNQSQRRLAGAGRWCCWRTVPAGG